MPDIKALKAQTEAFNSVIPKLWPAGHFWPAASYKMACQDLWSRIFYLHHISD